MEQRFFADTMLGKLARWLRVVGCDVAYVPALDDAGLVARAREEGRLILTRDTLLIRRRWAREAVAGRVPPMSMKPRNCSGNARPVAGFTGEAPTGSGWWRSWKN